MCQPASLLSEIGFYIGISVCVTDYVSQPINWGFVLESLCPSDHVFRLCLEDIFCTSQSFAAKLSQVVHHDELKGHANKLGCTAGDINSGLIPT